MRLEYFQLIDRIVALDVDSRSIKSLSRVPQQSTVFEGHFPGYPLFPGVLLIECMAQTTGWLVMARSGFTAMPFLAGVKEAKFRAAVMPGDELELDGEVVHEGSGFSVAECKGRRLGKVICEAQIIYRVMPFPNTEFRMAILERATEIEMPVKELTK
jgi:3-hydroxyacyl-[acyl-carrier-protein] dehydratase